MKPFFPVDPSLKKKKLAIWKKFVPSGTNGLITDEKELKWRISSTHCINEMHLFTNLAHYIYNTFGMNNDRIMIIPKHIFKQQHFPMLETVLLSRSYWLLYLMRGNSEWWQQRNRHWRVTWYHRQQNKCYPHTRS